MAKEISVFIETEHPAKFRDTVEGIIGDKSENTDKLQAFMEGEKHAIEMSKEFADFKQYLMNI